MLRPGPAGTKPAAIKTGIQALAGRVRLFTVDGDRLLINPDGAKIAGAAGGGLTTDAHAALVSDRAGERRFAIVGGTSSGGREDAAFRVGAVQRRRQGHAARERRR